MVQPLLIINGTDYTGFLKAAGGYAVKRGDVDGENAGRETMDATMYRDRIAVKMELTLACRPLTGAEARQLLNDPAEFLFRKPDGTEWWQGIKFPLIER